MKHILSSISHFRKLFIGDSLFRNSIFLIASTGIMSVLGFGFWLFVARLYTPEQIGVASALITVTTLLGNVSLLGLEASIIRYLPSSKNQSRDINASIVAVSLAAMLAAVAYLVFSPLLNIHIDLLDNLTAQIWFVIFMVVVGVSTLTDTIYIANRRAEFHTLVYTVLSLTKLLLPLFLVPFGSLGVFLAYAAGIVASLLLTSFLLRVVAKYRVNSGANWAYLGKVRRYAAHNYTGRVLTSLCAQVMPLIVLSQLGTAQVAYFAMAWTMANFLYIVPIAMAQSLLAESSSSPKEQRAHTRKAAKILGMIVPMMVLVAVLASPWLLHIFGPQYAANSTQVFQILALGAIFVAVNEICNAVLNVSHRTSGVVASQLTALIVTLGSSLYLLQYGLVGAGLAMVLGNVASNLCQLVFFSLKLGYKKDDVALAAASVTGIPQP